MKGFIKVIIAGAVIIGVGLAVLIIALGLNGWAFNPNFETAEFTSEGVNTALSIELDAGRLKIEYHDEDKIKISYPTAQGYETTVKESDGTVSLVGNKRKWFSFGCNASFPETLVKIPRNAIKTVNIDINAGGVEMAGGAFENVKIKVNAGACNVGEITGLNLLKIDLNAGSVSIDGAEGDKISCEVNAGRASIKNIYCKTTDVTVGAGLATLSFKGGKTEYNATVNVSAGSCNGLDNYNDVNNDKSINVKVSAGSADVSFKN